MKSQFPAVRKCQKRQRHNSTSIRTTAVRHVGGSSRAPNSRNREVSTVRGRVPLTAAGSVGKTDCPVAILCRSLPQSRRHKQSSKSGPSRLLAKSAEAGFVGHKAQKPHFSVRRHAYKCPMPEGADLELTENCSGVGRSTASQVTKYPAA